MSKKSIQVYNSNVHKILDNMDDDVFNANIIKNKKKTKLISFGRTTFKFN